MIRLRTQKTEELTLLELDEVNIMDGIKNFLQLINENWTTICVILGLIIGIVQRVRVWIAQSDDEKIEYAKKQISETMLKFITTAELDFSDWKQAGEIKRAQVIKQIYADYPILEKVADQSVVIAWIDKEIDESLKTLRKIVKENQNAQ